MKKSLFIITLMVLTCSVTAVAQQVRIAFFSYHEVLNSLPDYVAARQSLQTARTQYDEELKSSEQEFSDKYEMFVEQQSSLSKAIRDKRQSDLIDLYERNVKFRKDSEASLKQKEEEARALFREKIDNAVAEVGKNGSYLLVLNTDSDACPYIDPANSVDVTQEIIKLVKETK